MAPPAAIPLIDEILAGYAPTVGDALPPYRNHVQRVVHFCFRFHDARGDGAEKLIIAGCFHDLGMWPGDEIDYLAPSIALARAWLAAHDRAGWSDEIAAMIQWHHRFRRAPAEPSPLVEVFRRGDWVDASMGLRRFGLSRSVVREVQAAFPNLGFHQGLVRIALREFPRRPFNPLPMMRW